METRSKKKHERKIATKSEEVTKKQSMTEASCESSDFGLSDESSNKRQKKQGLQTRLMVQLSQMMRKTSKHTSKKHRRAASTTTEEMSDISSTDSESMFNQNKQL